MLDLEPTPVDLHVVQRGAANATELAQDLGLDALTGGYHLDLAVRRARDLTHEVFGHAGADAEREDARVRRVLQHAFARLRADGAFYQFTYGFRCPVPARLLDRLGLKATRVGVALRNLPPATIYRIERR